MDAAVAVLLDARERREDAVKSAPEILGSESHLRTELKILEGRERTSRLWLDVFENLRDRKRPKKKVLDGLRAAIRGAFEQRQGAGSLVPVRNARKAAIRKLREMAEQIDALSEDDLALDRDGRRAMNLAAESVRGAALHCEAALADIEGVVSMSPPPSRGQRHLDQLLVSNVNDVLAAHQIEPAESANFVRSALPDYWNAVVRDARGNVPRALTLLAKRLSEGRRNRQAARR